MSDEPEVTAFATRLEDGAKLPIGPRTVRAAALALGWETRVWGSAVTLPAVGYLTASDGHQAGDIRFPAKPVEHTTIHARAGEVRLGFSAVWATIAGKTAFESAVIYDPLGVFVEEIADYSVNEYMLKLHGADKAEQIAWTRSATYNTGTLRRELKRMYETTTPFFFWLDEWLDLKAPTHKRLSRKIKETTPVEAFGLGSTEWSSK
jgi:hypothetical protein